MTERTFSIIKPDATRRNLTGEINAVIEKAGLRIVAQRRIKMTKAQAEKFYEVHKERPFYGELVEQMTGGPVVVQVLEGDGAIAKYREVMGATNPANAGSGTIRKLFALSVGENSVHGSDAPETAVLRNRGRRAPLSARAQLLQDRAPRRLSSSSRRWWWPRPSSPRAAPPPPSAPQPAASAGPSRVA